MFSELESRFGPHSIDRFASALNTLIPRYNAAWLDPTCVGAGHCGASYASCMKQYFRFCEEKRRPALAADPGTVARYVTWLGNMATINASCLQPYPSAVNNFFKDHGREQMALSDLLSKVRKGLAAWHVTLHPELLRAPLPARVVMKALTLAKALRLELGLTWGTDPGTVPVVMAPLVHRTSATPLLRPDPQMKRAGGIIKRNTNAVKNLAARQAVLGDNVDEGSSPEPPAKKTKQPAKPAGGGPARGRGGDGARAGGGAFGSRAGPP
eukprot:jgi/Tetstr1/432750/TSEL_022116.t1